MQLGALLVREGLCSPGDIQEALESQRHFGGRLGTSLVENGAIELDALAAALARQRSMPAALLRHFKMVDAAALKRVPKKLAEKYRVIPIGVPPAAPTALAIAIVEPLTPQAFDDVAFAAGARLIPMIAPELRIFQALEKFYGVANADGGVFLRMGNAGRRKRAQSPGAELRSIPPPPAAAPLSMPTPPIQSLDMPQWPSRPPPPPIVSKADPRAPASIKATDPGAIRTSLSRTTPTGHTTPPPVTMPAPRVSMPAREPPSSEAESTPRATHLGSNDAADDAAMLEIVGPVSAASDALMFSKTMPAFETSSLASAPSSPKPAAGPAADPALAPRPSEASSSGEAFEVTIDVEKFIAESAAEDLFTETVRIPETFFAPTERRLIAMPSAMPGALPGAIETWQSGHDSSRDRSKVDPAMDVLEAIAHATKQDEVGDALTGYLRARFEVGLLLLVEGDVARGWRGFTVGGRSTPDATMIGKIRVTATESSLLREAFTTRARTHAAPVANDAVDKERLWRRLRCDVPTDAVVAPIVARDRVVALLVALALDGATIGEGAVAEIAARVQAASVAWSGLAVSTR